MTMNNPGRRRDSTRIVIDPPTFSPPPEMRSKYLEERKSELDTLLVSAHAGEWKPVLTVANHIRGTGAMYGFANIGDAAENLVKAVQNGESKSIELMEIYADVVRNSYI